MDKFGKDYTAQSGYILEIKEKSTYGHIFGGNSWEVIDKNPVNCGPTLLFVLNMNDPKLQKYKLTINEIPICSYVNCDIWLNDQVYQIEEKSKVIELIKRTDEVGYVLPEEDKLPSPMPEKKVTLREMEFSEYPIDEDGYWRNLDNFLGGKSFVRVAGEPLWVSEPRKVECDCGKDMPHIMSIGYEGWGGDAYFLDNEPFFFGEGALYAFICPDCLKLKIISQTT